MIKFFQTGVMGQLQAGGLVSDISDHFITFPTLKSSNRTSTPKTFSYRDFSQNNIKELSFCHKLTFSKPFSLQPASVNL